MGLSKNLYFIGFYFFFTVGLISCGKLPQSAMNSINSGLGVNVANIRDIKLERDKDAIVYLRGKVIRQVPLIGWQMYQLQDSTGVAWILTDKKSLRLKDRVLVKGKVRYQSIPLQGKDFGEVYVEEQEQLEHLSAR